MKATEQYFHDVYLRFIVLQSTLPFSGVKGLKALQTETHLVVNITINSSTRKSLFDIFKSVAQACRLIKEERNTVQTHF